MQHDTRESWHAKSMTELATQLRTDVLQGLTPQEAALRLRQDGPNALQKTKTVSPLALLVGQFRHGLQRPSCSTGILASVLPWWLPHRRRCPERLWVRVVQQ